MYGITEATPGPRWEALFEATWPAYRAWYLQDGNAARPDLATAKGKLEEHMPELVPTYERLTRLADDDLAARMLTMWDMPKFLPGCTQAVDTRDRSADGDTCAPVLVRNYDYTPELFEWVSYSSAFTGRRVVGTGDCLWGLLDGMNDAGLVISLTFGGRAGAEPGFGIPLVIRYLLEVAETVDEAVRRLETIPVAMAYNLTVADRTGRVATVFVAPGQRPEVSDLPAAANHRGLVPDDAAYAARYHSVERQKHALTLLQDTGDSKALADAFLEPPLHNTAFAKGFGTVYTAVYRPADGTLEYRWPDATFTRGFDAPQDSILVGLTGEWGPEDASRGDVEMSEPIVPQGGDSAARAPRSAPADADAAAAWSGPALDGLDSPALGALAREAMTTLAARGDQASFAELLTMNAHAGVALGEAARALAANGSWTQVADLTGTTKQAAWSRWRG